jgi:hypothetical protein
MTDSSSPKSPGVTTRSEPDATLAALAPMAKALLAAEELAQVAARVSGRKLHPKIGGRLSP